MNLAPQTVPQPSAHSPTDAAVVELAVRFIETDPSFAGADAVKAQLAAQLEGALLTAGQHNRLAAVLLRALRHGTEAAFDACARLAPRVASPLFEAAVTCYAASCQYPVAERARHVLAVLDAGRETPSRPADDSGRHGPLAGWHSCAARG